MPRKNKYQSRADSRAQFVSDEYLKVSFEYIDWDTEEFFFHGMEVKYFLIVFDCIVTLTESKEQDIIEQTHPSLCPKSIFNSTSSIKDSFPESVIAKVKNKLFLETRNEELSEKQAIEITSRASRNQVYLKNYGRIHGFIWNNIFHIVWFDPAHNLYPMRYGITKHKDAATVRCFSPEEVLRIQEKIKELQAENAELYEALLSS